MIALLATVAVAQNVPSPPAVIDRPAFHQGRSLSIAGIFLGWAGTGLAVGGATLALMGRTDAPLDERELLVWTATAGGGMAFVGTSLQIGGSLRQQRALGAAPHQPVLRGLGIGAGAIGVAGTAVTLWRLHQDGPDGAWLLIAAPAAAIGSLACVGLHTIALLQADATLEEAGPGLRVDLGPTFIGISGRF